MRKIAVAVFSIALLMAAWQASSDYPFKPSAKGTNLPYEEKEKNHEDAAVASPNCIAKTSVELLRPRLSIPEILQAGETFTAHTKSNATGGSAWNFLISSVFGSYALIPVGTPVEKVPGYWDANVTVPPGAMPGLYNLSVTVAGNTDTEPHAVSVKDAVSGRFSFVHMTDIHIGAQTTGSAYGNFLVAVREINLIRPNFVVITGDVCDKYLSGQEFPPSQQDGKFVEALLNFAVPVYVGSGNHDWSYNNISNPQENIEKYKAVVNPFLNYSFDYGGCHFIYLDTGKYIPPTNSNGEGISNGTMSWLLGDLQDHTASTQRFVMMHHPVYPDCLNQSQALLRQALIDNDVSMLFAGHIHSDSVYDRNGTQEIGGSMGNPQSPIHVTTWDTKNYNGYRLIRVDGTKIDSYTYDADGNGERDAASSMPMGKLHLSYAPSNNGTAEKVKATIQNDLREDFIGAFLELVMPVPKAGFIYEAENGTIERVFDFTGFSIYHMRANISSLKNITVTLKQVPVVSDSMNVWTVVVVSAFTIVSAVAIRIKRRRA